MWRSAISVFGITDRDLCSIFANVNMQHYGYQGITTDAGGKTIKSQNPEKNKTDPVYLFVPCDHKLCQYGGQMRKKNFDCNFVCIFNLPWLFR